MLIRTPISSRPAEPALFARAAGCERYRVAGGGLTVVALTPGDTLQIEDIEGLQPCELMAFDAHGEAALAALELQASASASFIASLLHNSAASHVLTGLLKRGVHANALQSAATIWSGDTPAGFTRELIASEALLVIVAA